MAGVTTFALAIAALFEWPCVHRMCGGVVLWAQREIVEGETMMSNLFARYDGGTVSSGEKIGVCPWCHHLVGSSDVVAGWASYEVGHTLH